MNDITCGITKPKVTNRFHTCSCEVAKEFMGQFMDNDAREGQPSDNESRYDHVLAMVFGRGAMMIARYLLP